MVKYNLLAGFAFSITLSLHTNTHTHIISNDPALRLSEGIQDWILLKGPVKESRGSLVCVSVCVCVDLATSIELIYEFSD